MIKKEKAILIYYFNDFIHIVRKPSLAAIFSPANAYIILPIIPFILSNALSIFYFRLSICWESLLLLVAITARIVIVIATEVIKRVVVGAAKIAAKLAIIITFGL